MTGLRQVPAARAGVFMVMLPITAATVGLPFLGERVNAVQLVAFGLALTRLLLATWPRRGGVAAWPARRAMPLTVG